MLGIDKIDQTAVGKKTHINLNLMNTEREAEQARFGSLPGNERFQF